MDLMPLLMVTVDRCCMSLEAGVFGLPFTPGLGLVIAVLHRESSKRLASPRNTKDRKRLQSTQSTVDRHCGVLQPTLTCGDHASLSLERALVSLVSLVHVHRFMRSSRFIYLDAGFAVPVLMS